MLYRVSGKAVSLLASNHPHFYWLGVHHMRARDSLQPCCCVWLLLTILWLRRCRGCSQRCCSWPTMATSSSCGDPTPGSPSSCAWPPWRRSTSTSRTTARPPSCSPGCVSCLYCICLPCCVDFSRMHALLHSSLGCEQDCLAQLHGVALSPLL